MYNGDYLEKILGEKYNIKNFYENNNDIISNVNEDDKISKEEVINKKDNNLDMEVNIKKQNPIESFQYQYEPEIKNSYNKNNNENENVNVNKNVENVLDDEKSEKSANNKNLGNENFIQRIKKDFSQFDEFYPDIYRILVPMIDVVIDKNKNKTIGIELIEEMAREIYDALVIDVNINNKNENENENEKQNENTDENEQIIKKVKPKNMTLLDLIKILILNKLKNKN